MIKEFYTNQPLREAVREDLMKGIEDRIVEMVTKREEVAHIADALNLINTVFDQRTNEHSPIKKVSNGSPR